MKFEGNVALLQQKMANSSAGVARRLAVMNALNLQTGNTVLDVGCGAGHLIREIGLAVGHSGQAFGLDPSEAQIKAAKRHCEALCVVTSTQPIRAQVPAKDVSAVTRYSIFLLNCDRAPLSSLFTMS